MKTHRNLYPKVWDFENLFLAYRKARRGKRSKSPVADFEQVQEQELLALQQELRSFTYEPGCYHHFYIHEPKRRLISAAPFRDRVVHHALCRVIEPIWERRFIHDSYANRVGKGTHRALDRCQAFARRYRYVLQLDIRKFFPSIDHKLLMMEFSRLIQDDGILWLCNRILASGVGVLPETSERIYYPGDDLFAPLRPHGLPIGNLTSQFWANVYLNAFDHFVKRELRCRAYLRFVDDMLLFDNDKRRLWGWKADAITRLNTLRLSIHGHRAQVYPVSTGIPFLGFRVYPHHRLVKRRKVVQFRRKLHSLLSAYGDSQIQFETLDASLQGWINHVRYGDTWGLRKAMLRFVFPHERVSPVYPNL